MDPVALDLVVQPIYWSPMSGNDNTSETVITSIIGTGSNASTAGNLCTSNTVTYVRCNRNVTCSNGHIGAACISMNHPDTGVGI